MVILGRPGGRLVAPVLARLSDSHYTLLCNVLAMGNFGVKVVARSPLAYVQMLSALDTCRRLIDLSLSLSLSDCRYMCSLIPETLGSNNCRAAVLPTPGNMYT